jgi:plasmid maintenance system killer protein
MKTLHILTLALALTAAPVVSNANDIADSSATVIQETIQNTVKLENNDANSRVFVVFSIAENGSVSVLNVGTLDAAVKASITEQFQSMSFDNTNSNYDGMYSIWLNFKSL